MFNVVCMFIICQELYNLISFCHAQSIWGSRKKDSNHEVSNIF